MNTALHNMTPLARDSMLYDVKYLLTRLKSWQTGPNMYNTNSQVAADNAFSQKHISAAQPRFIHTTCQIAL